MNSFRVFDPDSAHAADKPQRGRGATRNPAGRFEKHETFTVHDGWTDEGCSLPAPKTHVAPTACRTIITENDSPDVPFSASINPYKGCEHGCVYCFARPTHAYMGLSAGLDFETKIFSKPDAARALERAIAKPGYVPTAIALGANTDAYQPVERRLRITRSILQMLCAHHHPVAVVTKSELVVRDLDLLAPMAKRNLAKVFVSLTTLDSVLARRLEPRAAAPQRRLRTIERLTAAGVPVGLLVSPVIPGLTDHELDRIVCAGALAGATTAGTILLRLPFELKALFEAWLRTHYPHRASKVLSLLATCHGGRLYRSGFGHRMRGSGPYADMLQQRFTRALTRYGIALHARTEPDCALDCSQFVPPAPSRRSHVRQLPLFD